MNNKLIIIQTTFILAVFIAGFLFGLRQADNSNEKPIKETLNAFMSESTGKEEIIEPTTFQNQQAPKKIPENETANWRGKTTDWLGRKFDVNNSGKEYINNDLEFVSSSGWILPEEPYVIEKGELVAVEMNEGNRWNTYSLALDILNKAILSPIQRQYFFDNNYVPRSVEHFDVTRDGVAETVVTSLSLGCGRCVDFYMTIFTNKGKYKVRQREGAIIKTESGNGFYLIDIDYPIEGATLSISKYKWDKSMFTEIARKEVIYEHTATTP